MWKVNTLQKEQKKNKILGGKLMEKEVEKSAGHGCYKTRVLDEPQSDEKKSRFAQATHVISPSLIHTSFSLPKIFWSTEEFPFNFFGKMRPKNFDGKT